MNFNYVTFKQQWLTRCKELSVDPAVGPLAGNLYQIVLVKAEARIERKRTQAGWWDSQIHGRARDVGDLKDDQSTWNIETPDQVDIPTLRELWLEVTKQIRADVSPRNYERWQPIASRIGADLEPVV